MIKGTLANGFNYEIKDEALDNWELLEVLTEIDSGNQAAIVKAFPMLIGSEQFSQLKEHLKKVEGSVRITSMVNVFSEITRNSNELKK